MSAETALAPAAIETAPRAAWYPTLRVDAVRQVVADRRPGAFKLLGQDIVLWRVDDGPIIAQEDRCAHEDAELSTGYCRNGTLICAHHGWTHDPDGTSRPPGARNWKPPPKGWMKIAVYRTAELGGYVWVALEDTAALPLDGGKIVSGVDRSIAAPASRVAAAAGEQVKAAASFAFAVTPVTAESARLYVFATTETAGDNPAALIDRIEASL